MFGQKDKPFVEILILVIKLRCIYIQLKGSEKESIKLMEKFWTLRIILSIRLKEIGINR
jgi:hypothetical protein